MDSYVLFRGSKHVTLKEDDMTTEKISRIFQVHGSSVYITDDTNVAIFPGNDGHFSTIDLIVRGHYEVHGESDAVGEPSSVPGPLNPVPFAFRRPSSAAAGSALTARPSPRAPVTKTYQRTIFVADLVEGMLETSKTLTVRFSEFEASVMGITSKVNDALEHEESFILTDGQGNGFWIQREPEEPLLETKCQEGVCCEGRRFAAVTRKQKRRLSRRDDNGLDAVYDTIEEVVLAAQGLREVSTTIKELTHLASSNRRTTVSFTEAEAAAVKEAFSCVVCKGPVVDPMVSSCCHSIIGSRSCIEQWQQNSAFCPKSRADDFDKNAQKLIGLSDALGALDKILYQ